MAKIKTQEDKVDVIITDPRGKEHHVLCSPADHLQCIRVSVNNQTPVKKAPPGCPAPGVLEPGDKLFTGRVSLSDVEDPDADPYAKHKTRGSQKPDRPQYRT